MQPQQMEVIHYQMMVPEVCFCSEHKSLARVVTVGVWRWCCSYWGKENIQEPLSVVYDAFTCGKSVTP